MGEKKSILKILKHLANQMYKKHKGRGGADTDLFSLVTRDKTQDIGTVHISGEDRMSIVGEKIGTQKWTGRENFGGKT